MNDCIILRVDGVGNWRGYVDGWLDSGRFDRDSRDCQHDGNAILLDNESWMSRASYRCDLYLLFVCYIIRLIRNYFLAAVI